MDAQFSIPGKPALRFTGQLPAGMEAYRVPFSNIYAATGSFGQLLIQEIAGPDFLISYKIFQVRQHTELEITGHHAVAEVQLMLEGDLELVDHSLGEMIIKESCFNLYYLLPETKLVYRLKKGYT
ncbi:MAG: hypothetical protein WCF67_24000, partial [Chitinophagaceae bacterium]